MRGLELEDGCQHSTSMESQTQRDHLFFSLEVKKGHWPWVYAKGDKPALVTSTLEALAVLLALEMFFGGESKGHHTNVQIMPTWTDNRGNGSALNKMMSTRYPASAVVMEMSVFMKRHGLKALVVWTPGTGNREADELANGDKPLQARERGEDQPRGAPMVLSAQGTGNCSVGRGRTPEAVNGGALPDRTRRQKRRKPEQRLRAADVW